MRHHALCAEYNGIPTHHLCEVNKNSLVYPICLDKRGYDDLNYLLCESCDPNANDKN